MNIQLTSSALIERAKQAAQFIFDQNGEKVFPYHNLKHTEKVVYAADQIAKYYRLGDADYLVLMISAWFHDVGYFEDTANHEEKGVAQARRFLHQEKVEKNIIHRVSVCIMATRMPQQPKDLVEQILCDADLFHLGTEEFDKNNRMIREECNIHFQKHFTNGDWVKRALQLLRSHHYHTDYAKQILDAGKKRNTEALEQKIAIEQDELGSD